MDGWMNMTRFQPTCFPGAHLSLPKLATSPASRGSVKTKVSPGFPNSGDQMCWARHREGLPGSGVVLKQAPGSEEAQRPGLPSFWFASTDLPALEPEPIPGACRFPGAWVSIVALTSPRRKCPLSTGAKEGLVGREDVARPPSPLHSRKGLFSTTHHGEEGDGSADLRLTLRGSARPLPASPGPLSPGVAAGRDQQMGHPPAPGAG